MSDYWLAWGFVFLLLALIGLLPKFDSTNDNGWGDDHTNED